MRSAFFTWRFGKGVSGFGLGYEGWGRLFSTILSRLLPETASKRRRKTPVRSFLIVASHGLLATKGQDSFRIEANRPESHSLKAFDSFESSRVYYQGVIAKSPTGPGDCFLTF